MNHYAVHTWKQFFCLQKSDIDHSCSAEDWRRILYTRKQCAWKGMAMLCDGVLVRIRRLNLETLYITDKFPEK